MSTFADLYRDKSDRKTSAVNQPRPVLTRADAGSHSARIAIIHDIRIRAIVQQLFLRNGANLSSVGFVPVDESTSVAGLSLEVSRCLADERGCDVALVDCGSAVAPLTAELQLSSPSPDQTSWLIGPHLWFVSRNDWAIGSEGSELRDHNSRLREIKSEFDFSIFCCESPVALDTSVPLACDGVVLVITANKTRRMVASQIKDRLEEMQVPLLGSVLADRRFPVPHGLYQKL